MRPSARVFLSGLATVLIGTSAHAGDPIESSAQLYESRRVALHINGGVGNTAGMIGLSVGIDVLRNLFVEVGGGWDYMNGPEATLGVGAHVLVTPGVALNPVLSYSISERGNLLANFGCDHCDVPRPAHWVNIMAQLEVRTLSTFVFRFQLGVPVLMRRGGPVATLGAGLSVGFLL